MARVTSVQHDLIATFTSFGDLLRYLRQRAQLTQRDLALAVGYSISQISRLEHNERLPDEITLLSVFVPALGLEEEPATFERLLALACQARSEAESRPTLPATSEEAVRLDLMAPHSTPHSTSLPQRLTSFIGREQAVMTLQRLVKANRLVTLTGVGGVGKSSLALAVAETLAFPDGVWLLELAPITEGGLVARLVADLFHLSESAEYTALEAVMLYLQHKELLLIVDNCEHLIATCAAIVERLLQAAAKLHILATSREALNIAGEHEWPVLPLATPTHAPSDGAAWSMRQLQPFAAVQLFSERAQAMSADLRFTDQDAPLLAHLCRQLDGIPLALELAAARCKSLALAEIVARLNDRFALLSAGRRTALLRHQTLRATVDWSYDLLSPAEAALFRSLAVFAGGWTLAAAEQVATHVQRQPSTFDLLHQLVNKSLVVVDQRSEATRYRLLETIREYAHEKLVEQGEAEAVRTRHYACYLALVENAMPTTLLGAQFYQWCDEVKEDLGNLRAAFAWSQTQADRGEKSLRLAISLGPFWLLRANISEGSTWLDSALVHADPENSELYSWGLLWLAYTLIFATPRSFELATDARQRFIVLNHPGGIALANLLLGKWARIRGETAKAIEYLQDALGWFEKEQFLCFLDELYFCLADTFVLDEKREQALYYYQLNVQLGGDMDDYGVVMSALEGLAAIAPTQAIALCQQQLAQQRQRQNQTAEAGLLHALGIIFAFVGDLRSALTALEASLALWQSLGILWSPAGGIARTFLELGLVQYLQQEYQQAIIYVRKAVQFYQEMGVLHGVALTHITLGYSALAVNDLTLALSTFHKCLHITKGKDISCTYMAVVGLAEIAHRQAKPMLAAHLFGVTERFAQQLIPIDGRWKNTFCQPLVTTAHTHLRDAAYAASWAEGQAMPLEQAMQLILGFALS